MLSPTTCVEYILHTCAHEYIEKISSRQVSLMYVCCVLVTFLSRDGVRITVRNSLGNIHICMYIYVYISTCGVCYANESLSDWSRMPRIAGLLADPHRAREIINRRYI